VIYTSGSTGEPRGVTVCHRELAISTAARDVEYPTTPDRFLVVSSPSFDSSIAGLFWTLTSGGTIVLPTDAEVHDADALIDLFASGAVTHTLMVPSLYRGLLRRAVPDAPWPTQVIVAGEACGPDTVADHFSARPRSRLSNEYGPTEATVWATVAHLEPDTPVVPIGHPIPGVWTAIVDRRGELCPSGVIGELLIGGATVTGGYDGLSSDRFSTMSAFGPGRTFRTGDRAAVSAGQLYFHGRLDEQLSVGGLRIEPIEIEIACETVAGVEAAVVVARDLREFTVRLATAAPHRLAEVMRRAVDSDDPRSVLDAELTDDAHASIVAHLEGDVVDLGVLDAHLAATLPPTAIPSSIHVHERLPRLPNGKIDRAAVAALPVTTSRRPSPVVLDATEALDQIVGFYRDVLERADVGPDDDFFGAGGQSLLALELFMRIEQHYAIRPRISVLFEARTPRQLVAALGLEGDAISDDALVLQAGSEGSRPLWIWPGSDGALLIFEQLVSRLDPALRVLGVEYPGTRGERPPFETIEALGEYCYEVLIAAQPAGPYRMVGYSTGGLVAIDVARRLLETGEDVEYLGAIEAGLAGVADPRGRPAKFVAAYKQRGLRFATERLRSSTLVLADELSARTRRSLEDLAIERFGVRPSDRRLFLEMEHRLRDASLRYDAPTIDAEITLHLGEDASTHWITAMTRAWEQVAGRRLRVVHVSGSHIRNSMLLAPHVDSLAAAMTADLAVER
jgi:thioesterase domain-containing protein/acyl carrier protein